MKLVVLDDCPLLEPEAKAGITAVRDDVQHQSSGPCSGCFCPVQTMEAAHGLAHIEGG